MNEDYKKDAFFYNSAWIKTKDWNDYLERLSKQLGSDCDIKGLSPAAAAHEIKMHALCDLHGLPHAEDESSDIDMPVPTAKYVLIFIIAIVIGCWIFSIHYPQIDFVMVLLITFAVISYLITLCVILALGIWSTGITRRRRE